MAAETVWGTAGIVPPEWYGDMAALERLMEQLLARRGRVRELIASFRDSNREPFPLWEKTLSVPVPRQFAADVPGKFVM